MRGSLSRIRTRSISLGGSISRSASMRRDSATRRACRRPADRAECSATHGAAGVYRAIELALEAQTIRVLDRVDPGARRSPAGSIPKTSSFADLNNPEQHQMRPASRSRAGPMQTAVEFIATLFRTRTIPGRPAEHDTRGSAILTCIALGPRYTRRMTSGSGDMSSVPA